MKRSFGPSFLVAGIAIYASLLPAQTFFGSIVGSVTDASGASVLETTVTLTNTGTAERRTALTDGNRSYQFVNLVPGNYKVDAEKVEFRHFTRDLARNALHCSSARSFSISSIACNSDLRAPRWAPRISVWSQAS